MNGTPFRHAVAIDTNVFEHLFFPQKNTDRHINRLLQHIHEHSAKLLVDEKSRILREYLRILENRTIQTSVHLNETQLLRALIRDNPSIKVAVNDLDELMAAIESVIEGHRQKTDRTFVYIAFSYGGDLISNDEGDIVSNRSQLKRKARHVCVNSRNSRILNSQEAYELTTIDLHNALS